MTRYDPQKHHRRSIRLKGWDYRRPGWYFVTMVVQNRECLFGRVENKKMVLNDFGKICNECWLAIPDHFKNVQLDEYQIMPNHVHGIIVITKLGDNPGVVGARHVSPLQQQSQQYPPRGPKPGSIGAIIGSFRSAVSNRINKIRRTPGAKLWQRNYYEHIIRDENELNRIRWYIKNNPLKWPGDNNCEKYRINKSHRP
jgi:REP element-mobilizing transposase RayT